MPENEVDVAPIISKEKFLFFFQRLLRTTLGGLEFVSCCREENPIPIITYVFQIIILIFPFSFIISAIIAIQLFDNIYFKFIFPFTIGIVFGILIFVSDIIVYTFDKIYKKKKIIPEDEIFVDDDEKTFWKIHPKTMFFLFLIQPTSFYSMIVRFFLNSISFGLVIFNLVPRHLSETMDFLWLAIVYSCLSIISTGLIQYQSITKGFEELNQIEFLARDEYFRVQYFVIGHVVIFVLTLFNPFLPTTILIVSKIIIGILYVFLLGLPLIFAFGLLPKLGHFGLFLMEITQIHLLGGSASYSTTKTIVMFTIIGSILIPAVFILRFFKGFHLGLIIFVSSFAFTLSAIEEIYELKKIISRKVMLVLPILVIGIILKVLGIVLIFVVDIYWERFDDRIFLIVSYCIEGVVFIIFVVELLIRQLQRKYFVNLVKNPLFSLFNKKGISSIVLNVRKVGNYLVKLLLFGYYIFLNYSIPIKDIERVDKILPIFFECVFLIRAFRKVVRHTNDSCVEFLVTTIVFDKLPNHWPTNIGFASKLAICGYFYSKIRDFWSNIKFLMTFLISIFFNKNLKFHHWKVILSMNLICFIVPFFILLFSVFLLEGMWLIPFFGIPVFFIGYPRMKRFWSGVGNRSVSKPDTQFYEFLEKSMSCKIRNLLQRGGALDSLRCGEFFFMRSDPFIILCQILERNALSVSLSFKGLELQTTSCHAVEATYFDERFCECDEENGDNSKIFNVDFFHIYEPITEISDIEAYSIADSKLVGVIENSTTFSDFKKFFLKTVTYLAILKDIYKESNDSDESDGKEFLEENHNEKDSEMEEKKEDSTSEYSFLDNLVKNVTSHDKEYDDLEIEEESNSLNDRMKVIDKDWISTIKGNKKKDVKFDVEKDGKSLDEFVNNALKVVFPNALLAESAKITPQIIFDFFNKPPNVLESTFNSNNAMKKLDCVYTSFHYTIKLILDNILLAEDEFLEDDKEFLKKLEDFEENWRMGKANIQKEEHYDYHKGIPNLFNIEKDKEEKHIYRMILHQRGGGQKKSTKENDGIGGLDKIFVGKLNNSTIRAVWGNLNFEMIFVTSDDDERFSIQANKLTMNNILISAAEPPLGYPIHQAFMDVNIM